MIWINIIRFLNRVRSIVFCPLSVLESIIELALTLLNHFNLPLNILFQYVSSTWMTMRSATDAWNRSLPVAMYIGDASAGKATKISRNISQMVTPAAAMSLCRAPDSISEVGSIYFRFNSESSGPQPNNCVCIKENKNIL